MKNKDVKLLEEAYSYVILEQQINDFLFCDENMQLIKEGRISDYANKIKDFVLTTAQKTGESLDNITMATYEKLLLPVQTRLQSLAQKNPKIAKLASALTNPRNIKYAIILVAAISAVLTADPALAGGDASSTNMLSSLLDNADLEMLNYDWDAVDVDVGGTGEIDIAAFPSASDLRDIVTDTSEMEAEAQAKFQKYADMMEKGVTEIKKLDAAMKADAQKIRSQKLSDEQMLDFDFGPVPKQEKL